ncbi:MAG: hypothetical protein IJX30_00445 [Clostridia bacterium]|nr:hypothetical protein [Clostridia bacterium]
MKNWKRMTTFLLSLLTAASFSLGIAACGGETATSSSSDPSDCLGSVSNDESSSPDDNEGNEDENYPKLIQVENPEAYTWGDYELISEPTCTVAGVKQRRWTEDESVIHQEYITPRGHTYENGVCACGAGPIFPEAGEVSYAYPQESSSGIEGDGSEYNRYELTEGYYEIECLRGLIWLSFAIPESGQYALYTVGDADDSVELNRYDASAQYIPVDANGNYINFPARELDDGCLYSSISCNTSTWSTSWRATYSLKGKAGTVVKLRFVRIDDEAWSPATVRVQHLAQQINGTTAPAGEAGTSPTVVPYDTDYYYEESSGYYRMGTPENPGPIIYVAITMVPPRMLLDKAFTQIQYEAASNLYLSYGKTVDGDYLVRDYLAFISGDTDNDGATDEAFTNNCYKNFVNGDGLYPVNQELFEFLNLYVKKNCPMDIPEDIKQDAELFADQAWLAACYYYKNLTPGSKELPISLSGTGDITVSCPEYDYNFYTYSHTNGNTQSTISYCTISCDDTNALLEANGKQFYGPFSFIAETNAAQAFEFCISSLDGSAAEFTIHVEENYQGSQDYPTNVEVSKGEQTVTFETIEHLLANGETTYQGYYTLEIKADGVLDLSYSGTDNVYMSIYYTTEDGEEDAQFSAWTPQDVKAGDVIVIVLGPANGNLSYDIVVSIS